MVKRQDDKEQDDGHTGGVTHIEAAEGLAIEVA